MADFRTLVTAVAAAGGLDHPRKGSRPLDEVCTAFAADLPVDGVSMSILFGHTVRETVGSSGYLADKIEDEQYALGIGPCYDAFARGGPVLVADLRDPADNRWPAFSAALAQTPVRAVFAFPLHLGGIVVGAVDTYRTRPGQLDSGELRDVLRAVDLLVLALASAREPDGEPVPVTGRPLQSGARGTGDGGDPDLDDTTPVRPETGGGTGTGRGWEDFLDALPSERARVHQATGMVIGQLGGSPEQALARIRAHAFAEERSIVDVASDIVARRLILPH